MSASAKALDLLLVLLALLLLSFPVFLILVVTILLVLLVVLPSLVTASDASRRTVFEEGTLGPNLSDNSTKERSRSNGRGVRLSETQKSVASETAVGRTTKPASSTGRNGFGRTIFKKSLDMALRHMDIRQGMGSIRGTSRFPHSIRPTASKALHVPTVDKPAHPDDERMSDLTGREDGNHNGMISGDSNLAVSEDGERKVGSAGRESDVVRVNELDIYESSQYDARGGAVSEDGEGKVVRARAACGCGGCRRRITKALRKISRRFFCMGVRV